MGWAPRLVLAATLASHEATQQESTPYVQLEMYAVDSRHQPRWIHTEFGNENMYDAPGLVRYLMTEVLPEHGKDPHRTTRAGDIDVILRYRLKILNPTGANLSASNGEFAPFTKFVDGAAVDDVSRLGITGDEVGLQAFRPQARLESGATIPADLRFAFEGVYYSFSLSGPCPNVADADKGLAGSYHEGCMRYTSGPRTGEVVVGVDCQYGDFMHGPPQHIPTGAPGCSVILENMDILCLDEIAGIQKQDCGFRWCRDWADFRVNCTDPLLQFEHEGKVYCREFDAAQGCQDSCMSSDCDGWDDVSIPFWQGRCKADKNAERARTISNWMCDSPVADGHYATNPPCSRLDSCSAPLPEEGSAYCHRDSSGICDSCFIPGTVNPPTSRPPGIQKCRLDIFKGSLPQYESKLPVCGAECGNTCSDATDTDLCCVYLGQCIRDWQVGEWTECSAECGFGKQERSVECPFEEIFGPCDDNLRPLVERECHERICG